MRRGWSLPALCLALVAGFLTACSGGGGDDPVRLRVLAGPELAVLAPLLGELKEETGVDLRLDLRADAETKAPDRGRYDLAWLSSDSYLRLTGKNAVRGLQRTPTMTSPVVIGLKPDAARRLQARVPGSRLSWADLADAAATGTVRFGMADPGHAGSGLAALVGVATAAAAPEPRCAPRTSPATGCAASAPARPSPPTPAPPSSRPTPTTRTRRTPSSRTSPICSPSTPPAASTTVWRSSVPWTARSWRTSRCSCWTLPGAPRTTRSRSGCGATRCSGRSCGTHCAVP
ncbi:substrate-binding domain-containing protein [Streptomyces sp. FXY-T5]|uniref:substrate-binding domain-containing protein n=1 Tax=Streptomyces sp. FXY-T5 TaxID=3064901 RepID=UPI0027D2BE8B|nr:substrate-binding domain-containing protein [Streptomyces sp. FXY-T5]WMD08423.1 substrate-binding domain-containing protein [Streptomyces sp. FXY-T5]